MLVCPKYYWSNSSPLKRNSRSLGPKFHHLRPNRRTTRCSLAIKNFPFGVIAHIALLSPSLGSQTKEARYVFGFTLPFFFSMTQNYRQIIVVKQVLHLSQPTARRTDQLTHTATYKAI